MNCTPLEYRFNNTSKKTTKWKWCYPFTKEYVTLLYYKIDDNSWIKKVLLTIIENLDNEVCTVNSLSSKLFMSTSNLNRKIKRTFGTTTIQLIGDLRLQYAIEIVTLNQTTISEAISIAGYYDMTHFSRCFKKVYMCSPSSYKWENSHIVINHIKLIFMQKE